MPPNVSIPEPTSHRAGLARATPTACSTPTSRPAGTRGALRGQGVDLAGVRHGAAVAACAAASRADPPRRARPAAEVAEMLDSTVESVTSALKRARARWRAGRATSSRVPGARLTARARDGGTARLRLRGERHRRDRRAARRRRAAGDAAAPARVRGSGRGPTLLRGRLRASGPTATLHRDQANGQPALAFYSQDVEGGEFVASSLTVVTLAGDRFVTGDRFDASMLGPFGLPGHSPTNARATRPAEPSRRGPTGPVLGRSRSPRR